MQLGEWLLSSTLSMKSSCQNEYSPDTLWLSCLAFYYIFHGICCFFSFWNSIWRWSPKHVDGSWGPKDTLLWCRLGASSITCVCLCAYLYSYSSVHNFIHKCVHKCLEPREKLSGETLSTLRMGRTFWKFKPSLQGPWP